MCSSCMDCVQVVMHTVCGQVCVQVVNVMYIVCTGCMFSGQCLFTEFIYIVSTLMVVCNTKRICCPRHVSLKCSHAFLRSNINLTQ